MNRSETVPTAVERVAAAISIEREAFGGHQHLADALTTIGIPVTRSTLSRIEAGKQPADLVITLGIALLGNQGLAGLLRGSGSVRIGDLVVESDDDWRALLGEPVQVPREWRAPVESATWQNARNLAQDAIRTRTDLTIAASVRADADQVREASMRLFGRPAHSEISSRTADRAARDPDPQPGDDRWRAYRSHAVRSVTREIRDHLQERR